MEKVISKRSKKEKKNRKKIRESVIFQYTSSCQREKKRSKENKYITIFSHA